MDLTQGISALLPMARFLGIFAPTLYCGFTASDSLTFIEPIVKHAPSQKIMAKQWYQGYQYGPTWVPPMVASGTLSNLFLAYCSSDATNRLIYIVAAVNTLIILPITFFYMEPGINGALKWKVQTLLLAEDHGRSNGVVEGDFGNGSKRGIERAFPMPVTSVFMPSSVKHGGTLASRQWADTTDIKDLILFWRSVNNVRWAIGGVAAMLSGYATLTK